MSKSQLTIRRPVRWRVGVTPLFLLLGEKTGSGPEPLAPGRSQAGATTGNPKQRRNSGVAPTRQRSGRPQWRQAITIIGQGAKQLLAWDFKNVKPQSEEVQQATKDCSFRVRHGPMPSQRLRACQTSQKIQEQSRAPGRNVKDDGGYSAGYVAHPKAIGKRVDQRRVHDHSMEVSDAVCSTFIHYLI